MLLFFLFIFVDAIRIPYSPLKRDAKGNQIFVGGTLQAAIQVAFNVTTKVSIQVAIKVSIQVAFKVAIQVSIKVAVRFS